MLQGEFFVYSSSEGSLKSSTDVTSDMSKIVLLEEQ